MPELALFPLNTVLFPGGLLPLRIFEPRYLDMVGRCMREGTDFGVVLITSGEETGPLAVTAAVGTGARVVDFSQLPDGLLGVMCRGSRRFRVQSHRVQADGLRIGEVEWLAAPAPAALAAEHLRLAKVLRRVLEELGGTARFLDADFDDADWVSNRLAEFLPLERVDQQALLEMSDPQERMRHLAPLIEVPEDPSP
jgi:Lon protease-like protein